MSIRNSGIQFTVVSYDVHHAAEDLDGVRHEEDVKLKEKKC